MKRLRDRLFRISFHSVSVFLVLWLLVGFSLGTSTLIGPTRWIASSVRRAGWGQSAEDAIVGSVIIIYVLLSALITLWLTRTVLKTSLRHVRLGIPLLVFLSAAGAVWLWMTPAVMGSSMGEETEVGAHFTFGPYPTEQKMLELKERGYSAVISLLHPAVVPFEPKLLAEEKEAASRVDLELIHLPMLPWVSGNEEALERVEELALQRAGRYYVHCYLGRDRVHLVKRIIEQAGSSATVEAEISARGLMEKGRFERGVIYQLAESVYLAPYPTDEELIAFIRSVNLVVSLMDPEDPRDRKWIQRERSLLEEYRLPLEVLPIAGESYDPHQVLQTARRVWTLPRPLVVHSFLSPSTGRSPSAEAFMQAFRSNLPPLPPSRFKAPLAEGRVEIVAPNIAIGPRPRSREFGSYLYRNGVREFVYLGESDSPDAERDRSIARNHGFSWRASTSHDAELWELLTGGGPWYLYGPGVPGIRGQLAERFGPAVPEEVSWDAAAFLRLPEEMRAREAESKPPAKEESEQDADRCSWVVGFLGRALPGSMMVILLGPILALLSVLAGGFAGWLRLQKQVRAPYTRKVFHFAIFTLAGVLHLAAGLPAVVLFGSIVSCIVLYAVMRGDGFPLYEAMARPSDYPRRTLFIVVPLITTALGGLIGNLLFAPFAYVGYLVSGWGDAVAEPVGAAWGRHRYRVPSLAGVPATRSLEGSTAVMLVGMLAAFLGLWAYGIHPAAAAGVALACGMASAAVEAISNHGVDNLTIQVVASGTAFWLLG